MKAPEGHGSSAGHAFVCVPGGLEALAALRETGSLCGPSGRQTGPPSCRPAGPAGVAVLPALGTAAGASTAGLERASVSRCESDGAL